MEDRSLPGAIETGSKETGSAATGGGAGKQPPPPFVRAPGQRRAFAGWWRGLAGGGKLFLVALACALVVIVVIPLATTSTCNGTMHVLTPIRIPHVPVKLTARRTISRSLSGLRLSLLAFRLDLTLGEAQSTTARLSSELSSLSAIEESVAMLSNPRLIRDMDTPPGEEVEGNLEEEEGPAPWEPSVYGRELAGRYTPLYEGYLARVRSIQDELASQARRGLPGEPRALLARSCATASTAMQECIRGLGLLYSGTDNSTAKGVAAICGASLLLEEAKAYLDGAINALSGKD